MTIIKIPEGYKLVPKDKMTARMFDAAAINSEVGAFITGNWSESFLCVNELYVAAVNAMPDAYIDVNDGVSEIWAGTYFDQETQNEWRERKMTGSEKYHHSRVVESLQKEIAGLKEKLAKTEWQQIETAPKDGTEVILSKWSGSYATPETSFCWAINGYFKDGYWYSKDPIIGKLAEPTHWMPLSQPPTKGD